MIKIENFEELLNIVDDRVANTNAVENGMIPVLYTDDAVLIGDSEENPRKFLKEFDTVYKKRKVKVNAVKNKVMV